MQGKEIYERLRKFYEGKSIWREVEEELKKAGFDSGRGDFLDPFKNLVIGILSQTTSDRNATRAWIGLRKLLGEVTMKKILEVDLKELEDAIRPGGLHRVKARRIKQMAEKLKEIGGVEALLKLDPEEAKEKLLGLPGIGQKTADVFIAYCMKQTTFPVDTNIARVANRLGISRSRDYKEVSEALKRFFDGCDWVRAHELLIRLGRDFCRAKKKMCNACPIGHLCPRLRIKRLAK